MDGDSGAGAERQRDRGTAPKGDVYRGDSAAEYHRTRSVGEKWRHEQGIVSGLLDDVGSVATVLDVPFGSGRFVAEYLRRGWRVTGLDSSPDMFTAARGVLAAEGLDPDLVRMDVGDARALPYADADFDLVVCVRFLQSVVALGDVPAILAEIRRVCRVGAIVQLRVPAEGDPIPVRKRPEERMEHQCGLADQELLLGAAGLAVVRDVRDRSRDGGQLRTVLCRPVAPREDLLADVLSWVWIPDTV